MLLRRLASRAPSCRPSQQRCACPWPPGGHGSPWVSASSRAREAAPPSPSGSGTRLTSTQYRSVACRAGSGAEDDDDDDDEDEDEYEDDDEDEYTLEQFNKDLASVPHWPWPESDSGDPPPPVVFSDSYNDFEEVFGEDSPWCDIPGTQKIKMPYEFHTFAVRPVRPSKPGVPGNSCSPGNSNPSGSALSDSSSGHSVEVLAFVGKDEIRSLCLDSNSASSVGGGDISDIQLGPRLSMLDGDRDGDGASSRETGLPGDQPIEDDRLDASYYYGYDGFLPAGYDPFSDCVFFYEVVVGLPSLMSLDATNTVRRVARAHNGVGWYADLTVDGNRLNPLLFDFAFDGQGTLFITDEDSVRRVRLKPDDDTSSSTSSNGGSSSSGSVATSTTTAGKHPVAHSVEALCLYDRVGACFQSLAYVASGNMLLGVDRTGLYYMPLGAGADTRGVPVLLAGKRSAANEFDHDYGPSSMRFMFKASEMAPPITDGVGADVSFKCITGLAVSRDGSVAYVLDAGKLRRVELRAQGRGVAVTTLGMLSRYGERRKTTMEMLPWGDLLVGVEGTCTLYLVPRAVLEG